MALEGSFLSVDTLVIKKDPPSVSGKTSPLDFLAQASVTFGDSSYLAKWQQTATQNAKERITVVQGPTGSTVRIHKGSGKLPPMDFSKPFARKCRNRECNNLCGQAGKPRSIYCSKRCQSREQNLRQGRIKNVRTPPQSFQQYNSKEPNSKRRNLGSGNGVDHHSSDRSSSPSPISAPASSSSPVPPGVSPSPSPINHPTSLSSISANSPSPSPIMMMPPGVLSSSPLPQSGGVSMRGLSPSPTSMLHTLPPSPLTLRLGMTPSPLPISMSPLLSGNMSLPFGATPTPPPPPGTFSPIPMSSAISSSPTPIFLPKPTSAHSGNGVTAPAPVKPTPVNPASTHFQPPSISSSESNGDSLKLAPLRT